MSDFVHCNACFVTPSPSSTCFVLTNCRHILCAPCVEKARPPDEPPGKVVCACCNKPCVSMVIGSSMAEQAIKLFTPIEKLLAAQVARFERVFAFQEGQVQSLATHVNKLHLRMIELIKLRDEKDQKCAELEKELESVKLSLEYHQDELEKQTQQYRQFEQQRLQLDHLRLQHSSSPNISSQYGSEYGNSSYNVMAELAEERGQQEDPNQLFYGNCINLSMASSTASSFTNRITEGMRHLAHGSGRAAAPPPSSRPADACSSTGGLNCSRDAGNNRSSANITTQSLSPLASRPPPATNQQGNILGNSVMSSPGSVASTMNTQRILGYSPRGSNFSGSPLATPIPPRPAPRAATTQRNRNPYTELWKQRTAAGRPIAIPFRRRLNMSAMSAGSQAANTTTTSNGSNLTRARQQTQPASMVTKDRIIPRVNSPATFNNDNNYP